MSRWTSLLPIAVVILIAGEARAQTNPCGALELTRDRIRIERQLATQGPLPAADRACLEEVARELTARPGLRSVTVAVRVSDDQRRRGTGLALAREVADELARGGVKSYLLSAVAPALGTGEKAAVHITYRTARRRRAVARLLAWTGEVEVGPSPGELAAPIQPAVLSTYDRVVTRRGGALLVLADGSVLRLADATSLQLGPMDLDPQLRRRVVLHLHRGEVFTIVKRGNDGSAFDIITRVAVAGVRGTSFRVAADDAGRSRVETLTGEVELAGSKGKVALAAGTGSRVDASGVPEPPRALLAAPAVVGPVRGALGADRALTWRPVDGAAGYRVELARDPDFAVESRTVTATGSSHTVAADAGKGRWFWRVSPVDGDGFTGMPSKIYAFEIE